MRRPVSRLEPPFISKGTLAPVFPTALPNEAIALSSSLWKGPRPLAHSKIRMTNWLGIINYHVLTVSAESCSTHFFFRQKGARRRSSSLEESLSHMGRSNLTFHASLFHSNHTGPVCIDTVEKGCAQHKIPLLWRGSRISLVPAHPQGKEILLLISPVPMPIFQGGRDSERKRVWWVKSVGICEGTNSTIHSL